MAAAHTADPAAGLTAEQAAAYTAFVNEGKNIVVAGQAGSGKTRLIRAIASGLDGDATITATTGVAAIAIGGTTIHRALGLGTADPGPHAGSYDEDPAKFIKTAIRHIRKKMHPLTKEFLVEELTHLIVDEASMVSVYMLYIMDGILRSVRKTPTTPFGGVQVAFFGDMYQLCPVARPGSPSIMSKMFFECDFFPDLFPNVFILTQNFRQSDAKLQETLARIAKGVPSKEDVTLLRTRVTRDTPADAIRIYGRNKDVYEYNMMRLAEIDNPAHTYTMVYTGPKDLAGADYERLRAFVVKNHRTDEVLDLKEGALVMLLVNRPDDGLANGSIGTIIGFYGDNEWPIFWPLAFGPVPDFDAGSQSPRLYDPLDPYPQETKRRRVEESAGIIIKPHEWENVDPVHGVSFVKQIPLKLAYAMTIHKSQGMEVDKVVMSIDRKNCPSDGQAYVALSRCKTLDGIFIESMVPLSIKASLAAVSFYEKYKSP